MPFQKGHKKIGGRPKGGTNSTTKAVKAALVEAFDQLGGVPALVKWGKANPSEFYRLWGRLLPLEVKNPDGETFRLETVTEVVVRTRAEAERFLELEAAGGAGRPVPEAG